jgi:hypothetical protein
MDRKRIIGEVAARHGVLLAEDDPAFLLVTIAEIALRDAQSEFLDVVRRTIADQEEAAERMQKSIGETLGNSIRRALSEGDTVIPPRPVWPEFANATQIHRSAASTVAPASLQSLVRRSKCPSSR